MPGRRHPSSSYVRHAPRDPDSHRIPHQKLPWRPKTGKPGDLFCFQVIGDVGMKVAQVYTPLAFENWTASFLLFGGNPPFLLPSRAVAWTLLRTDTRLLLRLTSFSYYPRPKKLSTVFFPLTVLSNDPAASLFGPTIVEC